MTYEYLIFDPNLWTVIKTIIIMQNIEIINYNPMKLRLFHLQF